MHSTISQRLLIASLATLPLTSVHADLEAWQTEVSDTGTLPTVTYFVTPETPAPSGKVTVPIDLGPLAPGEVTYEFIVNAGTTGASGALLGHRASQALKFLQAGNPIANFGFTEFGVMDYNFGVAAPLNQDVHVVIATDGGDSFLYVNGEPAATLEGSTFYLEGLVTLGGVRDNDEVLSDPLDGHILGFAVYESVLGAEEIGRHYAAWAEGQASYSLENWRQAVSTGAPAAVATQFDAVSGLRPMLVDVGAFEEGEPRSFEFVVNAGGADASNVLLGKGGTGNQGLKFEQWNNTDNLGLTVYGVADHDFGVAAPYHQVTHLGYASDGANTRVYLDGELIHTLAGTALNATGIQLLATGGTIRFPEDPPVVVDPLDGNVLRFASYASALSDAEIAAHYEAVTDDDGSESFTAWADALGSGTAAAATHLEPVPGTAPILVDVGTLTAARTFEFIVFAGDAGNSSALLGSLVDGAGQGLKFEQNPNTLSVGFTEFGVADHVAAIDTPVNELTHLVFVSEGEETRIYLNGALADTLAVPLAFSGEQMLAAVGWTVSVPTIASYSDRLDGHVLGFASYGAELTAADFASRYQALLGATPVTPETLNVVSVDYNGGQTQFTWESAAGATYLIHRSTDLATWQELTAAHPSGGATTTYTDTTPPANAPQLFYKATLKAE